jgi:GNAT acetyltransferase-like protein
LGHIRPLRESDIVAAARLHQNVFEIADRDGLADRYKKYFTSTFLCPDRRFESLVHEEQDGRITGFLGVVTREFTWAGGPLHGALSTQFVVDPEARRKLVAVAMMREFFCGPQDFSFTDEANEPSRKIWEMLGGSTLRLHSTNWSAPIRPVEFLLSRKRFGIVSRAAVLADALIVRARQAHLKKHESYLEAQPLDARSIAEFTRQSGFALKPTYSTDLLRRYLNDRNRGAVLVDSKRKVAGWYLYDLDRRGIGELLQVGCTNDNAVNVLAHLFRQAMHDHALILYGRLEPHFSEALPEQFSVLSRRQYRVLVHSRNPKILDTMHSGKAFLSRLDGEWPVRFRPLDTQI